MNQNTGLSGIDWIPRWRSQERAWQTRSRGVKKFVTFLLRFREEQRIVEDPACGTQRSLEIHELEML
ncbi:unnamed protein product [Lactuca virosa]|uniref:Uncharacterized protein n=1 Tax=Lactuca virosa TaxID=75947 RepID=A0AAU9MWN9_9ASTR|nr:unnamed protein product [Lactuca virosa]